MGSKLKNKIRERMERLKKLNKPPTGKALDKSLKLPIHKDTSKRILIIQQSDKKKQPAKPFDRRNSERTLKTARVSSRRLSRQTSQLGPGDGTSGFSTTQGSNDLNASSAGREGEHRATGGTSKYSSLREQLSKITLEVFASDCADEASILQRQRRTRKERRKKSITPEDSSEISKKSSLMDLNATQCVERPRKANVKRVATARGSIQVAKAAAKLKNVPAKSRKEANPHMARKYLNELYAKILFKVKDMERERKVPLRMVKRVLEKCPSLRGNISKKTSSKIMIAKKSCNGA